MRSDEHLAETVGLARAEIDKLRAALYWSRGLHRGSAPHALSRHLRRN
jgi:hypothetical protein